MNGERGISEFLSNSPKSSKSLKKQNPENSSEIFDKNDNESEGIDFEEVKDDEVNKEDEIIEDSYDNGENEVRLTEKIKDNTNRELIYQKKNKQKIVKQKKSAFKGKESSKVSSKYTPQSKSKRRFYTPFHQQKKLNINLKNRGDAYSNNKRSIKSKKNVEMEEGQLFNEKEEKDDEYTSEIDGEESSAAEEELEEEFEEEFEEEEFEEEQRNLNTKISRKSKTFETRSDVSEKEVIRRKYP